MRFLSLLGRSSLLHHHCGHNRILLNVATSRIMVGSSYHSNMCVFNNDVNNSKDKPATPEKKEEEERKKINFSFDMVEGEDNLKRDDWYMNEKEAAKNFEEEENFRTNKSFISPTS